MTRFYDLLVPAKALSWNRHRPLTNDAPTLLLHSILDLGGFLGPFEMENRTALRKAFIEGAYQKEQP